MKIREITVKNFKRFNQKSINFCDPETGLAQNLIVLLGHNGSGKSTILQAIAMMLATATQRLSAPDELHWPGFDLALVNESWIQPMEIELEIEFSQDEFEATRDYFAKISIAEHDNLIRALSEKIPIAERKSWIKIERSQVIRLQYDSEGNRVYAKTLGEYLQFSGRRYARMIQKNIPDKSRLFKRVGGIFWYTEERTTNSLSSIENNGKTIQYDMKLLRRRLSNLYYFHQDVRRGEYTLKAGQRDIFEDIAQAYQTIFPKRQLSGPLPRTAVGDDVLDEPWFYLNDGVHQYELSEMSAGERAIFPIIFDFATWDIHNSIILIDELELHLHPPYQQALLSALQKLGTNNQFIITTHSDAVESITPPEMIRRL